MGIRFHETKIFRILFGILIFLVIPFIGNRAGKAYGDYLYEGHNVKWINLGKPPGEVNNLLACLEYDLWIESTDGEIYNKKIEWKSNDLEGWVISNAPELNTNFIWYEITNQCHSRFYEGMKKPPKDTIECCRTEALVPDGIGEKYYALLSDGNVWVWQYRTYGGPAGILNIYYLLICCSTLIGLILGIITIDYMKKKYRETKEED